MTSFYLWLIKAVSATALVLSTVLAWDLVTGTAIAQSVADLYGSLGFTVSVDSPIGAPKIFAAPEIDAASGTSAIALLTGVLLLAGERFRSRRS